MLSSLSSFCIRLEMDSGRVSDDCDISRAFCAEPRIRSRLKLAWRLVLVAVEHFGGPAPFVAVMAGVGISMEKVPLPGMENGLAVFAAVVTVPVAEWGELPVDDGDILSS